MNVREEKYRAEVLRLARRALAKGEVPVGAVMVSGTGRVLGRGYNQTHSRKDGLAHAELVALRQAQKKLKDWRMEGASLYVTLEPCLMCLGAVGNARVGNVYYWVADPLFGSIESKLSKRQAKKLFPKLNCRKLKDDGTIAGLMKDFFRDLRKQ